MDIGHTTSLLAILDDDKAVQSAVKDLIESVGLSTLCFDSAEEFLDSGARHQAACLIADIGMPGISGIELQARLKAEQCWIPIIFSAAVRTLTCAPGGTFSRLDEPTAFASAVTVSRSSHDAVPDLTASATA